MKNSITLLSSFAKDVVLRDGKVVSNQIGGPAFFISNVFASEGVSFAIQSPKQPVVVEISVTKDGEVGKISERPEQMSVQFSGMKTPALVISTLLDEFRLNKISEYAGRVFLDVQGYVRDGNVFGKKKFWEPTEEIIDAIFCLKGTEEELRFVSKRLLDKVSILLRTKGKRGCEIVMNGKQYSFFPPEIVVSDDTIGAGDTFFASFISAFLKTEDVSQSSKYAMEKTAEFLKNKNHHPPNSL